MATKLICDGCGEEIKKLDSGGLSRQLQLSTGNIRESWDLCEPCQGRIANAIAEILPHKPRETWPDILRLTKPA
jgi:hypothetical protein